MNVAAPDPLRAIRSRIDAIDEAMHRLLIERSGVIAELIRVKGASRPGTAFRPDREADMMRRLVQRHEGDLPLVTVEHIWREIITTFTAMQAPFGIAAGPSDDALAMRDAIRFYFGFSIPVTNHPTSAAAVASVAASAKDIAVVTAVAEADWWRGLEDGAAPKIFAKLPFIQLPDRPAGLEAYVVGPPIQDGAEPDISVLAMSRRDALEPAIVSHGGQVVARGGDTMVVELPVAATLADLAREAGEPPREVRVLGGFAQPIRFLAGRTA